MWSLRGEKRRQSRIRSGAPPGHGSFVSRVPGVETPGYCQLSLPGQNHWASVLKETWPVSAASRGESLARTRSLIKRPSRNVPLDQVPLWGTVSFRSHVPGVETPGYCQLSYRDKISVSGGARLLCIFRIWLRGSVGSGGCRTGCSWRGLGGCTRCLWG